MTVIPRSRRARRRGPAPLAQRFPRGQRVQVYEDFHDPRFAGRYGTVVSSTSARDAVYPRGRVEVRLVLDDLYAAVWRQQPQPPKTVWFKPADLDRHPEHYEELPRGEF